MHNTHAQHTCTIHIHDIYTTHMHNTHAQHTCITHMHNTYTTHMQHARTQLTRVTQNLRNGSFNCISPLIFPLVPVLFHADHLRKQRHQVPLADTAQSLESQQPFNFVGEPQMILVLAKGEHAAKDKKKKGGKVSVHKKKTSTVHQHHGKKEKKKTHPM